MMITELTTFQNASTNSVGLCVSQSGSLNSCWTAVVYANGKYDYDAAWFLPSSVITAKQALYGTTRSTYRIDETYPAAGAWWCNYSGTGIDTLTKAALAKIYCYRFLPSIASSTATDIRFDKTGSFNFQYYSWDGTNAAVYRPVTLTKFKDALGLLTGAALYAITTFMW